MIPFLLVSAFIQIRLTKDFHFKSIFKWENLKLIAIVSFFMNGMSISHVVAGHYTIMSHAFLFGNLASILIVLYSIVLCKPIHRLEVVGTGISIIGCCVTLFDSKVAKVDTTN